LDSIEALARHALFSDHPRAAIRWDRVDAFGPQVFFGEGDKRGARVMEAKQPLKIHVTLIHHIEGPCFEDQHIEHPRIVGLAIGEVNKRWDCAPKVQKGMDLDRRLGGPKQGPSKVANAQVDGAEVQGMDRLLQIQPQVLLAVNSAGTANQRSGQIGPDSQVPALVGLGKGTSLDRASKAHAIEFVRVRAQPRLDVSRRPSPLQLRKSHDSKLLGRRQRPHACISLITLQNSGETRPRDELHDLCKQRLADVHGQPPESLATPGSYPFLPVYNSNRHQTKLPPIPRPVNFFSFARII